MADSDTLTESSYGGNIDQSCGFKSVTGVVPRQGQKPLRKQSAGEVGESAPRGLSTSYFSTAAVKASVSIHHGMSRGCTRRVLFGGRSPTQSTTTMEDNHNHDSTTHEERSLSNPPLTTDLLESRRSSRIYKVESMGGVRENGKRLKRLVSALSCSIDISAGLLEGKVLLEESEKSSRKGVLV